MADTMLDQIKARRAAATPGPWEADRNLPFSNELIGIFAPDAHEYVMRVDPDEPPRSADAEFIANAPADIDYLTDELARLQQGIDEALAIYESSERDFPKTRMARMANTLSNLSQPTTEKEK